MGDYQITYHEEVKLRDVPRLDFAVRASIIKAIDTKLCTRPEQFGKPLQYSYKNHRSLRVGEYRIVYVVRDATVFILTIGHRKHVYDVLVGRI